MAFLGSLITNLAISVHGKKGSKQISLEDYMPKWDVTAPKEVKTQSVEEMKKAMQDIARVYGKKKEIKSKPPTLNTKK